MLNSGANLTEMKYWLAVGTPQNWKTAFDLGNTWGLKSKGPQATNWKQVQIGDILIFYAVSPVKGIIGYGVVQQKLKQNTPLWPEESAKKEVIGLSASSLKCDPVYRQTHGSKTRSSTTE
jgi:EVE domain